MMKGRTIGLIGLTALILASGPANCAVLFGPYAITGTLPVSFSNLGALAFSEGSLYAADTQGYIHQLDALTGEPVRDWLIPGFPSQAPDNVTGLAWDGSHFWLATYNTSRRYYLRQLTLGPGADAIVGPTFTLSGQPTDLTYRNGQLLYSEYLGPIRTFDLIVGREVGSIPSPSQTVYGLAFDGQDLLAAHFQGGTIYRISALDGSILETWQCGAANTYGMAHDADSQTLFTGTRNSGIIRAQIVPEPATAALWLLAFLGLLTKRTFSCTNGKTALASRDNRAIRLSLRPMGLRFHRSA